jgi:hypothetical protein
MLVIDRDHQVVCVEFVPKWVGTSTGHPFNDIFHVHIEQGRTDRRTLMNTILQVEALSSTPKVQSIMHALQEIHLVVGKCMFLLQDPAEAVAIDRVIGRFAVYENATFILIFLE